MENINKALGTVQRCEETTLGIGHKGNTEEENNGYVVF
jgi:hypothetical protein